jgi:GxxExxY protein
MVHNVTPFNKLTEMVIGSAIEVHKHLGPGLLEKVYEECLAFELIKSGLHVDVQKEVPVQYKDVYIRTGYRIDLLVENRLIVELKAMDKLLPIHEAQLLTYMKLFKSPIGLLINFNESKLVHGLKRMVLDVDTSENSVPSASSVVQINNDKDKR